MPADFSKICKRPSMTTWFVHDCAPLLDVDRGNRWCSKWQSTIKVVGLWLVSPLLRPNKWNNLSRQDTGRDILRSRQQDSDILL